MFELNTKEWQILRSQFVTSRWGGTRYLPFVFTEQGVAMLSTVINSPTAIQINISIMRAFIAIRQFVLNPPVDRIGKLQNEMREIRQYIEDMFTDQNDINEDTRMQIEIISQALAELQTKKANRETPTTYRLSAIKHCNAK